MKQERTRKKQEKRKLVIEEEELSKCGVIIIVKELK